MLAASLTMALFAQLLPTGVRLDPVGDREPDGVDDALFNHILWSMLKGDQPMPRPRSQAPLHLLEMSR